VLNRRLPQIMENLMGARGKGHEAKRSHGGAQVRESYQAFPHSNPRARWRAAKENTCGVVNCVIVRVLGKTRRRDSLGNLKTRWGGDEVLSILGRQVTALPNCR